MTNSSQITLNQFFCSQKELSPKRMSSVESCQKMCSMRDRVLKEAKCKWPIAFEIIVEKIADILNIGILDIMVMTWEKYRILLKYADCKECPPGETFLVPLLEHTIKSEHCPFIEIMINGKPVGKINFHISICLMIEGMILKIQDGKIKEITTGSCKGKGTVMCENFVILEKKTGPICLPGSISLGEGIPIIRKTDTKLRKTTSRVN
jgi:hypothetical protein